MKPYKYFENIIKDRSKERDTDISDELAKKLILFFIKKILWNCFTGTTILLLILVVGMNI